MDKETRAAIERTTQRARKLLEADLAEQLEGTYDVLLSGKVPPNAGERLQGRQRALREKVVAAIEHKVGAGMTRAQAVADHLRDAAFTTLNRFAALKMLEARELVQECVSKGEESNGYRELCGLAPGLALLPGGAGYRLYLECLFDELSTEVKVLFDRRDPASALWPRRQCLTDLLALLNAPELAAVWAKDETIGWIYQYFNSADERGDLREESQAPRNSRELAVRNQFFTPRYVVEFLTDNTLGRIWYEMQSGRTRLAKRCEYLVRRPDETYAPRLKKDPRDLRVLDPACGSGHFLLYAFDLLLAIYEEAWDDPEAAPSERTGRTLRQDHPDREALKAALPGLILRHNLHGVDIDARCAQIAQLALWLRAQRAFRDLGVSRAQRPRIRRANVVVAEPIPAPAELRRELLERLGDARLAALFDQLVEQTQLAGELGLLLRVEELVRTTSKQGETHDLFAGAGERLRTALQALADDPAVAQRTSRRLFADDALAGLGLVEVAEKRYDVVLMNPPFGDPTAGARTACIAELADASNDLGAAFVLAARRRWGGRLGVLSSTALWFKPTVSKWRRAALLADDSAIQLAAHLGGDVLDGATVNASAVVVDARAPEEAASFFRLIRDEDKDGRLRELLAAGDETGAARSVYRVDVRALRAFRGCPISYWISHRLRDGLASFPPLEGSGAEVRVGVQASDDPRFVRAWWEVSEERIGLGRTWAPFAKSSEYSPFWDDITWVIRWERDGREVRAFDRSYPRGTAYFGRSGVTYPARSVLGFNPRALPAGSGFGHMGSVAFPTDETTAGALLGFLASRPLEYVLSFSNGSLQGKKGAYPNHYEVGQLKDLPWPTPSDEEGRELERLGTAICTKALRLEDELETTHQYRGRPGLHRWMTIRNGLRESMERRQAIVDEVAKLREELDSVAARLLRFDPDDLLEMRREFDACEAPTSGPWSPSYLSEAEADLVRDAQDLLSELFGMAIGRFDVRYAAGTLAMSASERSALEPLPVRSLAQLRPETLMEYPFEPPTDGILVDDPGHARDVGRAISGVFAALWPDAPQDRRDELCSILGVTDIHAALRARPSGFFSDHVRRYTKSRRKAPIYWQLAVPSGRYSVWLYLHRMTKDTLYTVQKDYVGPKLRHEESRLTALRQEVGPNPTQRQQRELEAQETFVDELRAFHEEVARVAPLWRPVLDDGVLINFAPLWWLVPQQKTWQKECKATWDALCAGEYDWSHLAMHLWPERVVPKCAEDRSLAIAHELEDVFWEEDDPGKWKARPAPTREVDDLVRERTSAAVKAALKSLLEAPIAGGAKKKVARGRRAKSGA